MWNKPYSMREGSAIVIGLMLTGALLQLTVGPLEWGIFAWPVNLVALVVLVALLFLIRALGRRIYFCRFVTTMQAAVPAIAGAVALTFVMGITRQVAEGRPAADPVGLSRMLNFWPFILVYTWMTLIAGEAALKQTTHFTWRKFPALISHVGLFVVLACGTIGSADRQELKMYCEKHQPEWRGLDAANNVHELPIAIQLARFTIDEYPPRLMAIDAQGLPLPRKKPANLLIDGKFRSGRIEGWDVRIIRRIDNALPAALGRMVGKMPEGMMTQVRMDSLGMTRNRGFVASHAPGAACALLIRAAKGNVVRVGWVSCGSYQFPYQALALDRGVKIVMPDREPRRFVSTVDIFTRDGRNIRTDIAVNHPYTVNGWKIYQLSYDEAMGKWSLYSVFELVTDPWLPVVYTGIVLLFIGAVGMFLTASSRKETEK